MTSDRVQPPNSRDRDALLSPTQSIRLPPRASAAGCGSPFAAAKLPCPATARTVPRTGCPATIGGAAAARSRPPARSCHNRHIQNRLQRCGDDPRATRGAEDHLDPALLQDDGRRHRGQWALAGGDGIQLTLDQTELVGRVPASRVKSSISSFSRNPVSPATTPAPNPPLIV